MQPAGPGDGLTPNDVLQVAIHVVPIIIAVVAATIKIVSVLRIEIRSEIGPIMTRIDGMEQRFVAVIRDLWDHTAEQDHKIEGVIRSHYELKGSHDAIISMGGHRTIERRKSPREPHCTEP